jgi:hypothetical protein
MGGGGGAAGGSGAGGTSGAGMGGSSATAGSAGASGNAGAGGAGETVEYRACVIIGGVTRLVVHRLDRAAAACIELTFHEGTNDCPLGPTSNGWCLRVASRHGDVAACEARHPVAGTFATSAEGTFTIHAANVTPVLDMDLALQFGAGQSQSVQVEVEGCSAACSPNDCRP